MGQIKRIGEGNPYLGPQTATVFFTNGLAGNGNTTLLWRRAQTNIDCTDLATVVRCWLVAGGCWLVAGGWRLVVVGCWLVVVGRCLVLGAWCLVVVGYWLVVVPGAWWLLVVAGGCLSWCRGS